MKSFAPLLSLLMLTLPIQAKELSKCEHECFKTKYDCNISKSYTFNTCDEDLFTCRASCGGGKKQNYHQTKFPMDISFEPILVIG